MGTYAAAAGKCPRVLKNFGAALKIYFLYVTGDFEHKEVLFGTWLFFHIMVTILMASPAAAQAPPLHDRFWWT